MKAAYALVAIFIATLFLAPAPAKGEDIGTGTCGSCCGNNCSTCPVDCKWEWSKFSECSASCGGGFSRRSVVITRRPQLNGTACPDFSFEDVPCNTQECPDPNDCVRQDTDFVFVIMRPAGSTDRNNLENVLSSIGKGIFALDVRQRVQKTRVAAFTYDGDVDISSGLNFTSDPDEFDNFVTSLTTGDGDAVTGAAMAQAAIAISNLTSIESSGNFPLGEVRPGARRVIVLFTGKISDDDTSPGCNNPLLEGVRVVGVGFGANYQDNSQPEAKQLKEIVNLPLVDNYVATTYATANTNDPFFGSTATHVARRLRENDLGDTCQVFGNGHIATFDGVSYTFNGRGVYTLIAPCDGGNEEDLHVQVQLDPCDICPDLDTQASEASSGGEISPNPTQGRTCARGYAMSLGGPHSTGTKVEVQWAPDSANVIARITDGGSVGNPIDRQSGTVSDGDATVTVTQRFLGGFDVSVVLGEHSALFRFSHTATSAQASFRTATSRFSSVTNVGLCGKYDLCPQNDFESPNRTSILPDLTTSEGLGDVYVQFGETWRVNYDEIMFTRYDGENHNFDEWTPDLTPVNTDIGSFSDEIRGFCTDNIDSASVNAFCLSDVAANDNSAAIGEQYRRLVWEQCLVYCQTGLLPTAALTAALRTDAPQLCDRTCQYQFSRSYVRSYDGIHTPPPDTLPTVDLRGLDLPGAFFSFHAQTNAGGTYTFRRNVQRPDLCADEQSEDVASATVKVTIACLPQPAVSALTIKRVYYGSYGWPSIQLRGVLDFSGIENQPEAQEFDVSWKIVEFIDRANSSTPNPMNPKLTGPNSLFPTFTPNAPGIYRIEFAATDGCGVARQTINVEAVERCCTPESATQPLNALLFQQQGVGVAWGSSSWTTNGSSITMPQLSPEFTGNQNNFQNGFDPTDEPFANAKDFRPNPDTTDIEWTYEVVGRSATPGGDFVGIVSNNMSVTGRPDTTFLVIDVERNATVDQFNTTTEVGNTTNVTVAPTPSGNRLLQRLERLAPVVDIEADFTAGTTTTTTVSRKEVTRVTVPEVSTACEVSLNTLSQQTSRNTAPTQTVTVAVPSNVMGDTTYATRCTGFYKIRQTANVIGYSEFCAKDHDLVVEAACARAPVAQVSCPDAVEFDYMGAGFPDITLIGNGSYGFNANNYSDATTPVSISYLWQFVSAPEGVSIGPLPSCSTDAVCSFSPTVQGTYDATLTVTDGCSQDVVAFSVRASCGEPTNAVIQGDTTVTYTTPGVIGNPRGFLNASMSTSPGTLGFGWSIVGTPAGASVFRSVPAPTITATGRDATFNAFFAGVYTVRLEADDMCTSEAVNQSVTVTCASAVSTTALTDMTSTFAGGSFPDVTFMTTPSGGAGGSGPYTTTWYLLDSDGNVTDTSVGTSVTVNSTRPEVRTVVVETTDGCNFATRSATITSTCGTNTQPKISGQTATPVSSPLRVNRPFFLNATVVDGNGVVTYEWTALRAGDETPIVLSTSLEPQDLTLALPGTYTLTLTATDECGQVTTATVPLTVVCFHTLAATARAYPTSVEYVNGRFPLISVDGNTSNIDGENKTDVSYTWTFLSAPALSTYFAGYVAEEPTSTVVETAPVTVTLANGTIVETFNVTTTDSQVFNLYGATLKQRASTIGDLFPACFHPDLPGTYELELTITDGCSTSTSTVSVTAGCPAAPGQSVTITPGAAVTINEEKDTIVYLDASASTTNSATDLDFSWVIVDEPLAPDTNESNHTATTLYNANRPVASFVPLWVGSYVFELTLDDGCTTSKQNYTVTVTQTCTVVTDVTPSTITAAYNYLAPVTQTFCLDAPFQTAADGATAATSTASDTHNTLYPDADGQDAMYPQYSEAYSGLYKGLTQLQCDNKYTWEIVDFEPQTTVVAKNPCDGNDDLIVCGGDGVNNALQSASTRATFSGAFVIALAAVAAVLGQ